MGNRFLKAALEDRRDAIETAKRNLEVARSLRSESGRLSSLLNRLDKDPDIAVYTSVWSGKLYASVGVSELDGFGGKRLLSVLEKLSAFADFSSSKDEADSNCREFKGHGFAGKLDITVRAYLKTEAANCRRVLVKMERGPDRPVYAFECH